MTAIAAVTAAALVALCIVLERRRGRRSAVRIAVSTLAVLSLLLLFLRPARTVAASSTSAVLLTPGTTIDPSELGDGGPRFAIGVEAGAGAVSIPDLAYLTRRRPEVDRLKVLGHGLPAWEWDAFPGEVEVAEEAPAVSGVRELTWPRALTLGEDLVVRGVLAVERGAAGTMRLEGPGGIEDSVALEGDEEQLFELRSRPRTPGRFLYRWALETADAGLRGGTLDVVVRDPDSLAVLWLESAPGFETRHFKKWLTERGGRLAVRSRISRDRFRTELHHLPRLDLARFDAALLEGFDLLVVDEPTLSELPAARLEAVRSAVRELGVGLLIRGEGASAEKLGESAFGFRVAAAPELDAWSVAAGWPGVEPATPLVVAAREIEPDAALDPIVTDATGRWIAASRDAGAGAVGLTLLGGSYRWVLEGHAELHGRYWRRLTGALGRPADLRAKWRLPAGPLLPDEPLEVTLEVAGPIPEARIRREGGHEERLALRQDVLEPRRWWTRYWPRESGWHRLSLEGEESEAWFYVEEEAGGWTAWRQERLQAETRRRAVLGTRRGTVAPEHPSRRVELPRSLFYLAFLACVGYLWAVERWRS